MFIFSYFCYCCVANIVHFTSLCNTKVNFFDVFMNKIDETYKKALKYLIDNEVTAYEIHKFSGQSQTGLRKVFEGTVENPRRKTKEIIIEFYNNLIETNSNVHKINSDYTKGLENFTIHQIATYVIDNADKFDKEEMMKVLYEKSILEEANKLLEAKLKET